MDPVSLLFVLLALAGFLVQEVRRRRQRQRRRAAPPDTSQDTSAAPTRAALDTALSGKQAWGHSPSPAPSPEPASRRPAPAPRPRASVPVVSPPASTRASPAPHAPIRLPLRSRPALRQAMAVMAVIGPCRAIAPHEATDAAPALTPPPQRTTPR